jgi:ABC-type ATPase involved in cell division
MKISISNYRCFSRSDPATVDLDRGFTALVGPNNSGKSSFLKFFFEFRQLFRSISAQTLGEALTGKLQGFDPKTVGPLGDVFSDDNDGPIEITFNAPQGSPPPVTKVVITVPRAHANWSATAWDGPRRLPPERHTIRQNDGFTLVTNDNERLNFESFFQMWARFGNSLYIGPFRNILSVPGSNEYFDLHIGQAFIERWNNLKTGGDRTMTRRITEVSDAIMSIFGLTRLEINASPQNRTLMVVMSKGRSYRLDDLGSGLAQFVAVLATAAIARPEFVLIDEPELNLHPTLQMDFLTNLGSFAAFGVAFATHNIGLARAGAERVYAFHRSDDSTPPAIRAVEDMPRLSEFLGELSYGGYHEVGYDKVLLVEGVTEVKTVQQWLRRLGKDHTIVTLHLGGDNLINGRREDELAEIKRIAPNVYALIDSERGDATQPVPRNRQDFQGVCARLGITCCVLERRATENYFPGTAIERALGRGSGELGPYDSLGGRWKKSENWRIAREMTIGELDATGDLAVFLRTL